MYIILHRDAGFSRAEWLYTKCFSNRVEDMEDDTRVAVSVIGEIEQRGHGESHRVGDKNELYRCCITR